MNQDQVKEAADYYGINQSQFIVQAVNEKLDKRPPSMAESNNIV